MPGGIEADMEGEQPGELPEVLRANPLEAIASRR
jgi:hypothetical protein